MRLFETICEQIGAVRLPLFAVTLTALPRADTPLLLILHWHGFARDTTATPPTLATVPGSTLQINVRWHRLASIDDAMLEAAWRLGAWELDRDERRAPQTAGASARETLECRQAFGAHPLTGQQSPGWMVIEAPDQRDLLALGGRVGYVHWQFRPVHGGVWRETARADDTIGADGMRVPPCPIAPAASVGTRVSRTRYRLGRSTRILIL